MALFAWILAAALLVVLAVTPAAYWRIFRRPLPRVRGAIRVAGPASRIEISRDPRGVPSARAESWPDLAFAQGFLHGQDRLWHLELGRRVASGRLSEVVGDRGLGVDRLMRRVGLHRVSEAEWHVTHATGELRRLVEAYAAGVNAAAADRPLPAEFTILRHRPEPWEPADTLTVGRLLSFSQSLNWEAQLVRMRLVKEVGPELAIALDPGYPPESPVILRDRAAAGGFEAHLVEALRDLDDILDLSSWVPPSPGHEVPAIAPLGSNAWAVHGSRTATGFPLLANDPHSALTIPSAWYQAHLQLPGWEFSGITFSGIPLGAIGRTRDIAWGLTNAGVSVQDLYVERFNPNNPLQFLDVDGSWQDAVRFRETIRIRGAEPVNEDVLVTRRGPIISPGLGGSQPALALRWVSLDSEIDSLGWLLKLNRARDWKGFRAAIGSMPAPAMSVTYADVHGNIGYRLSGFLPQRAAGRGSVPGRGWSAADQWQGFVAFEDVPEVLNPPEGYIVNANNLVSLAHPQLVMEPSSGARAARIDEVLAADAGLSVEACIRLQNDVRSSLGGRLRDILVARLAGSTDVDVALGLDVLGAWDLEMDAQGSGGLLYQEALAGLERAVLGDLTTPGLRDHLLGRGVHDLFPTGPSRGRVSPVVVRLVEEARMDPRLPPDEAARDAVLARVLGAAVASLVAGHGRDPRGWHLSAHRAVSFDHPLGSAIRALRPIFSRGPYPMGGDGETVRLADRGVSDGWIAPAASAFMRAVYDMSPGGGGVIGVAPGMSGHPGSRHYADLVGDWLAGRPASLPLGEQATAGRDVLVIEPAAPASSRA